jgi:ComF family protein
VSIAQKLISLLVPPLCASCGEPELDGQAVCADCLGRLVRLRDPRCGQCGAPVARRCSSCVECRGRTLAFDTAWSPVTYEGVARSLVTTLKTRGAVVAAGFMAGEMAARAPDRLLSCDALVPVPAHAGRWRRHGFNHACSISIELGRRIRLPVLDLLTRERSATQVGLERSARLRNLQGSVRVRKGAPAGRLVLVDDVYTTGATLDACARCLREAGATEVAALTFARALRHTP